MNQLDKKEAKLQRKIARHQRQKEIDSMKITHEWVAVQQLVRNQGIGTCAVHLHNSNVHCKVCGLSLWNFKAKPISCKDSTIKEVIS